MRVYTILPQDDLAEVPAAAQAAEAAGYDGVVTMENRNEPFVPLGVAAVHTRRVALATGIAIAFPRSPMVVASASWDLQVGSRGRFVLGLGTQIRPHNERRFSVPWSAPAPRLREYVEALRAIWRTWQTGSPLDYRGRHYTFTLMTPNFTPRSTGQPMVPVTVAAVGPHMLRLAGEVCDGVRLHAFCTRAYLDEVVMPALREGLARSGRPREHFEISGGGFVASGPDEAAVAQVMEWVRSRVAFYGSTPAYWPVLERHGLGDLGRKLNVMSKAGQWGQMAREIADDVVRLFAAVGTHREIAREIERRFGGAVDTVTPSGGYGMRQDLPPDVIRAVQRIPAAFTGYRTSWT
jgi:probable F420-dependent oxidoreductase